MDVLDIDERVLKQRRNRPPRRARVVAPPVPGPNWVVRIASILFALLAAAIAYQYLVRPLLRG